MNAKIPIHTDVLNGISEVPRTGFRTVWKPPRAPVEAARQVAVASTRLVWLLLFAVGSFNVHPADLVWTNASGGSWNTAANWSPNQVPNTNDRVWITNSGTYTVTVSGSAAAGELTLGGASGTQTVSLTSGTFLLGRGVGNSNGVLRISGGTLGGSGGLFLAGPLNWSGGTITNTVRCAGGAISGSSTKTFRYGCLINTGLLTFSGGYLELQNGATISNLNSGTFDVTADCDINQYSSTSGPIYNSGVFRKSAGTGAADVRAEFHNTGSIEVQTGSLRLGDGGRYSGVLTVRSNAVLSVFGGTHQFEPGSVVTCDGTVECGSVAVLNLGTDITVNVLSVGGGRLTGAGTVTASSLVWSKGTIECTVRCAGGEIPSDSISPPELSGGRIINSGHLRGGLITTKNGAVITNLASGVFDFTNSPAGIRHDAGAYGAFHNAGVVRCTGTATVCSIGEPFYNTGTVESEGGGGSALSVPWFKPRV